MTELAAHLISDFEKSSSSTESLICMMIVAIEATAFNDSA
jgi:hypothetical protein